MNSRISDPSHWLTSERVKGYLEKADKFPHRSEGENVLQDFIPKTTRRVLDLGTGDGKLVKILKTKIPNAKYVAIDFSPPMLRTLKRRFGCDDSVRIIRHNLDSSLPRIGYFDAIISSLAIHHLKQERKKDLYSEIYSILKSGGVFCNFDHFASASVRLTRHFRRALGGQRPPNKNHEARLNAVEAEIVLLKKLGFIDVDCYWKWLQFALLISFKPK